MSSPRGFSLFLDVEMASHGVTFFLGKMQVLFEVAVLITLLISDGYDTSSVALAPLFYEVSSFSVFMIVRRNKTF